jgi:hypothetical protein
LAIAGEAPVPNASSVTLSFGMASPLSWIWLFVVNYNFQLRTSQKSAKLYLDCRLFPRLTNCAVAVTRYFSPQPGTLEEVTTVLPIFL